jgi:hypothetical protein
MCWPLSSNLDHWVDFGLQRETSILTGADSGACWGLFAMKCQVPEGEIHICQSMLNMSGKLKDHSESGTAMSRMKGL